MHFIKISLILFSNIFICKTEGNHFEELSVTKADSESQQCQCFPGGKSIYPELFKPQDHGLQRLVIYIYRDIHNNQIKVLIPGPEKQNIIPNIPVSATDEVNVVTSETIASLINKHVNKLLTNDLQLQNTGENFIGFIPGTEQTMNTNIFELLNDPQENYLRMSQVHEQPNNYQQYSQNIYSLQNPQRFLNIDQQNTLPNSYQKNQVTDIWKQLSLSDVQTNSPLNVHSKDPYNSNVSKVNSNTKLTFDQWFNQQMKVFYDEQAFQNIQTVNTDILKPLIQKVLLENNINIEATGLITDANGAPINLNTLELRPVLIGNPVTYEQVLQENFTFTDDLPYLEGILITFLYPPRILGVIPLRNTYYIAQSNPQNSPSVPDGDIDVFIVAPEQERLHHTGLSPSVSKQNLKTNTKPTVFNANQAFQKLEYNNPPIGKPLKASDPSHRPLSGWLNTLLKTILNFNSNKGANASKKHIKTQNQLVTESQDKSKSDNNNPSGRHVRRAGYDLNPYQNFNKSSLLNSNLNEQFPLPKNPKENWIPLASNSQRQKHPSLAALNLFEPRSNLVKLVEVPSDIRNPTSGIASESYHGFNIPRNPKPFNIPSHRITTPNWFNNQMNDIISRFKPYDLSPQTIIIPSKEGLIPIASNDWSYQRNKNIPYRIKTYNRLPTNINAYTKAKFSPSSSLDWKTNLDIKPIKPNIFYPSNIALPSDFKWNALENLEMQNHQKSELYPIILTPCDSKINSPSSSKLRDYPNEYNRFDFTPKSKSLNLIPIIRQKDATKSIFLKNKNVANAESENMLTRNKSIPSENLKQKTEQRNPNMITSLYTDTKKSPYYTDWISHVFKPYSLSPYFNQFYSNYISQTASQNKNSISIPYDDSLKLDINTPTFMTNIARNNIKAPQNWSPSVISSTFTDPNLTPHENTITQSKTIINPRIISSHLRQLDSNPDTVLTTTSNLVKSERDIDDRLSYLRIPRYYARDPYLLVPKFIDSSGGDSNLIYDDPLNFQLAGEERISPGPNPFIKPIFPGWNPFGLTNKKDKFRWKGKNYEINTVNSENSMEGSILGDSDEIEDTELNNLDGNDVLDNILGINNNENRRQIFGNFLIPSIKGAIKSVIDILNVSPENLDNITDGRRHDDQENNTVDDFIEKPGKVQSEDRPDYRIIGGSAATGSGSPVSNKGRSGFK